MNLIQTLLRNDPLQTLREWALLEAYQLARREKLNMPSQVVEAETDCPEAVWGKKWAAQVWFGEVNKRQFPRVTSGSHDSAEAALLQLILDLRAGKIYNG